jgi:biopolymer transport protein ExbB/TolQ
MTQTALIRPAWTPATIALMVLGFMVFWPLGLAMLAYIIWGDRLDGFKADVNRATDNFACSFRKNRHPMRSSHSSGNAAFDDWRDTELSRLDEERKKLDEMRREFDQHMRDLRMARDREEFDRFMAVRQASQNKARPSGSVPEIDG